MLVYLVPIAQDQILQEVVQNSAGKPGVMRAHDCQGVGMAFVCIVCITHALCKSLSTLLYH